MENKNKGITQEKFKESELAEHITKSILEISYLSDIFGFPVVIAMIPNPMHPNWEKYGHYFPKSVSKP